MDVAPHPRELARKDATTRRRRAARPSSDRGQVSEQRRSGCGRIVSSIRMAVLMISRSVRMALDAAVRPLRLFSVSKSSRQSWREMSATARRRRRPEVPVEVVAVTLGPWPAAARAQRCARRARPRA